LIRAHRRTASRPTGRAAVSGVLALLVVFARCGGSDPQLTRVTVRVEMAARRVTDSPITVLKATVEDDHHSVSRDFSKPNGAPLVFPTTFGIELGVDIAGPIRIDVKALDAAHVVQAQGSIGAQPLVPGQTVNARLFLECARNCIQDGGPSDAGADGPPDIRDASRPDIPETCGNGQIEPGETCDIAIPAGRPGACPPPSCDDSIACTNDMLIGDGCTARCFYAEILEPTPGDGCCPANATHLSDSDCSATCGNGTIEPGETCDSFIPAGQPGACPTAASCLDVDACTTDILISASTCAARCIHQPITAVVAGDGCCPAGASNHTDPDCPEVCGNGFVDPSETCDIARPAGTSGSCPPACEVHGACVTEQIEGSACRAVCRAVPVTDFMNGDGCCPPGGNRKLDSDCPTVCGNGVVEPGEQCDKAIAEGQQGACPTSCGPVTAGCMISSKQGNPGDCTATCVASPITVCSSTADGCCPAGCTTATDPDCSATCGNGTVDPGESCDREIPDLSAGSCPQRCDDNNGCTTDSLLSGGTCNARCQFTPITAFNGGDGCCPLGGNHNVDTDCPFVCGNGVVEAPRESCDPAIAEPAPGACPSSCPAAGSCKEYALTGVPGDCTARCEATAITDCRTGDACCPSGCNHGNDGDCPAVCGNGVVEQPDEPCDKAITAGNAGACPASCDDNDACTVDTTSGRVEDCTRVCTHAPITACAAGDRCCPTGCTGATDSDCVPVCPNGLVEMSETCDPPTSCPSTCADDGDPCTAERLSGDARACNVRCEHIPILTCSGATSDRCCPTGCAARNDSSKFDTDCSGGTGPGASGP
jgi:hypothetical protein